MSVGQPQQVLSGKYRLERELGRGGMGSVWLAQHLTLRSPVAIKLIDPQIATNPEALSRFLREAQSAASLRSPHVVQILDHGVDEGVPFIVMELLDGESLAARLVRVGRLSPRDTAHVITQVARAMSKAHEAGIVHRDLKPDNIYLVRNDEEEIAKVLDFGIAKSQTHGVAAVSTATRTGSVLGTPYYMSPEQAEGAKGVDHRTDIWAMGVIAWECLVGARPFDAETLGGLLLAICARDMPVPSSRGAVPAGFDAWFGRTCSRDLNYRFSTAREAAAELRKVCDGEIPRYSLSPAGPQASGQVPVQAASLPLASTTAHLGLSSQAVQVPKKAAAPWIALAAAGVAVLGAGAFVALRSGGPSETASASSPPAAPSEVAVAAAAPPSVAAPVASPSPTPVAPPSASAAVAVAPVAAPAPVAHAAVRGRPHAAPVEPAKPAPVAAPAPAPAAVPAAPAHPRVNLGI